MLIFLRLWRKTFCRAGSYLHSQNMSQVTINVIFTFFVVCETFILGLWSSTNRWLLTLYCYPFLNALQCQNFTLKVGCRDHNLLKSVKYIYLKGVYPLCSSWTKISWSKLGKRKVFPYSLPSVGPGADPCIQAVSPQVTWSHSPGCRLPLLSARPPVTFPAKERHRQSAGTKLYCLVIEAHACEQFAQGCYLEADRPRFEPTTFRIASEHYTVQLKGVADHWLV